jgi:hypothetical protein
LPLSVFNNIYIISKKRFICFCKVEGLISRVKRYSASNYFASAAGAVVFVSGASAAGASFAKERVARTIAAKTITFFMRFSF